MGAEPIDLRIDVAACPDITLHILPRSGHCQNFANTRLDMYDRIDRWVRDQAGAL